MAEEESIQGQPNQTRRDLAPRSAVWQHYTRLTDDHGKKKARCKRCFKEMDASHGTTSLKKHVKWCSAQGAPSATDVGEDEERPPPPQQQPAPPHRASSSRTGASSESDRDREPGLEEASKHLARLIALRGCDPSVLEDDCFRSFVASLNPGFELPSRLAIEAMCDDIFDETRKHLWEMIMRAPGKVSLAVGTVTVMETFVLYTSCHFIDAEWNLHKVIMDVYVDGSPQDYHGPLLRVKQAHLSPSDREKCIDKVMADFSKRDVLHNLFSMVWETDNHSIDSCELRNQIEQKQDTEYRRRTVLISTSYMDNVIRAIARSFTVDPDFDDEMTSALKDLHLTRQKCQELVSRLGLDYNPLTYREDWYLSYCSLEVLRNEGNTSSTVTCSEFSELLSKLCGEICRAIQRISTSNRPTSNLCLLELFKLREVLQSLLTQASGGKANAYKFTFLRGSKHRDVAGVIREAMDDLNRWIHDSYLLWSIPLILDPRYKLKCIESNFKRIFGSEVAAELTSQIKQRCHHYIEYDCSGSTSLVTTFEQLTAEVTGCQHAVTELDRYLNDCLAPQTEDLDVLKWWKDNSRNYPTVARMARDALAMPTCSKPSSHQIAHIKSILRGYSKASYAQDQEEDEDEEDTTWSPRLVLS